MNESGLLDVSSGLQDARSVETLKEILRESSASNTKKAYAAGYSYWEHWHQYRFEAPLALPLPDSTVLQFIADHAKSSQDPARCALPAHVEQQLLAAGVKAEPGPPALNTLLQRLSILSKAHEVHQLPNPCQSQAVREVLRALRRTYAKRGLSVQPKDALTVEPLKALLACCDDSLTGLRDRALLLFAFSSGGRRRSEVVAATVENTLRVEGGYLYQLGASKTNQSGRARAQDQKPIVGEAAEALSRWLAVSQIRQGPIFRRIRRGNKLGAGLSPAAVNLIVKQRASQAGLQGDFSAHSLRAGFVTEAGKQRIPLAETMAMTGHSSVATVMRYFRAGEAISSQAARLMDHGEASGEQASRQETESLRGGGSNPAPPVPPTGSAGDLPAG
ncbi:MAG: site-specific integrase [Pigmentiphaga sp.]|nr:site-specific integrase [Pigmentiphaga sp.]